MSNMSNMSKLINFEPKLMMYIDIYNMRYECRDCFNICDTFCNKCKKITYTNKLKIEKIGNIEVIYKNFSNIKKSIAKKLIYSIYQIHFYTLLYNFEDILNNKGFILDFNTYKYELYTINCKDNMNNMYIIYQSIKHIIDKLAYNSIIFIIINEQLFVHYC